MMYYGRGCRGGRRGRGGRGGPGGRVVKVVIIVMEAISVLHSFLTLWYNQRGQNRRGSFGSAAPVPRLPRVIKEGNLRWLDWIFRG